jgi:hypothetical protein
MLISLLNIAGLVFDIIGVTALFYLREEGIEKIRFGRAIYIQHRYSTGSNPTDEMNKALREVDRVIDGIQDNNKRLRVRSKKWLLWIFLGFFLQLAANAWSLIVEITKHC